MDITTASEAVSAGSIPAGRNFLSLTRPVPAEGRRGRKFFGFLAALGLAAAGFCACHKSSSGGASVSDDAATVAQLLGRAGINCGFGGLTPPATCSLSATPLSCPGGGYLTVSGTLNLVQMSRNGNTATIGVTGTATTTFGPGINGCQGSNHYVASGTWTQTYNSTNTISISGNTPPTFSYNINGSVTVPNSTVYLASSTTAGQTSCAVNLTDTFNNVSWDPSTTLMRGSVSYQGTVCGQQNSGSIDL